MTPPKKLSSPFFLDFAGGPGAGRQELVEQGILGRAAVKLLWPDRQQGPPIVGDPALELLLVVPPAEPLADAGGNRGDQAEHGHHAGGQFLRAGRPAGPGNQEGQID